MVLAGQRDLRAMKRKGSKLAALLSALLLAGSLAAPPVSSQSSCDPASIVEYQRYEFEGHWIVFIVPPKLKRECLIAFVETTHRELPNTRLEFFDSKGLELGQYILSASHGLDDAYYYPEKWMAKHNVANLYAIAAGRGPSSCDWILIFKKNGDDAIVGRDPCH